MAFIGAGDRRRGGEEAEASSSTGSNAQHEAAVKLATEYGLDYSAAAFALISYVEHRVDVSHGSQSTLALEVHKEFKRLEKELETMMDGDFNSMEQWRHEIGEKGPIWRSLERVGEEGWVWWTKQSGIVSSHPPRKQKMLTQK